MCSSPCAAGGLCRGRCRMLDLGEGVFGGLPFVGQAVPYILRLPQRIRIIHADDPFIERAAVFRKRNPADPGQMHFINGFAGELVQLHPVDGDLDAGPVVPSEIGGHPGFQSGLRSEIFLIYAGRLTDHTEAGVLRVSVVVGEIAFVDVGAVAFVIVRFRSNGQIQPGAQASIIFSDKAVFGVTVQPELGKHRAVPGNEVQRPRESALVESEYVVQV